MDYLKWLLNGDPVIKYLTTKYLNKEVVKEEDDGFIKKYLSYYNPSKKQFNGYYSPKWVSSHYTLLELKYMEINPMNQVYQEASIELLNHMWPINKDYRIKPMDMCVTGMMLSIFTYAKLEDKRIYEMVDYILDHTVSDGGWNCRWNSSTKPARKHSLHTTISILEGLNDYKINGYTYRLDSILEKSNSAIELILNRNLYLSSKGEIIHPEFINIHYPVRWHYDILRALEFFVDIDYPYDARMAKALDIVKSYLTNGFAKKGKPYTGLTHFKLETEKYSYFNTFRCHYVLNHYKP